MADYILYLDEANNTSVNPFFCLAGIVIARDVYENTLIDKVNVLKKRFFFTTDVIFHYTDMKKNIGEYIVLQDGEKRNEFWQEFNKMLLPIDFVTMGVYLHMDMFKKAYSFKHNKHYCYAFSCLMNNYITFLKNNSSMGAVVFESRQWKENAEIQRSFMHILEYGTDLYSSEECQKYLSTLSFFTKKDNCVGLQIADFVPDSFMRKINGMKNFCNVRDNFIKKMYGNDDSKDVVGLRRLC